MSANEQGPPPLFVIISREIDTNILRGKKWEWEWRSITKEPNHCNFRVADPSHSPNLTIFPEGVVRAGVLASAAGLNIGSCLTGY